MPDTPSFLDPEVIREFQEAINPDAEPLSSAGGIGEPEAMPKKENDANSEAPAAPAKKTGRPG